MTLTSRCTPQVDLAAILATAREIAAGMAYLHADNILHGDLTAGNILLISSPKDCRQFAAKVCLHSIQHRQPLRCEGPRRNSVCPPKMAAVAFGVTTMKKMSHHGWSCWMQRSHIHVASQIADFGLSRVMVETSISTGTYGTVCLAPPGRLSLS